MAEIIHTSHQRDLIATDEMIRNLRAGRFRNIAIGVGAAGALLMMGAAPLVWASRQGNDPEALKEALKNLPPLAITVKIDPESKVALAEGGKVELAEGGTVALEPGAKVTVRGTLKQDAPPVLPKTKEESDPAIQTTVTVFKSVRYGAGSVTTGWRYANGAAKTPFNQYCYFQTDGHAAWTSQAIGTNGTIDPAPLGVDDQSARFSLCQWFNGGT